MIREVVLVFGTYNPVTLAHISLGKCVKALKPEADIIYIPSRRSFIKTWKQYDDDNIFSDEDRINLLRKCVEAEGFSVDTLEVDEVVDGRTILTIEHFKKTYDTVYICMGMDKVLEFHKWYRSEELVSNNKFLICTRAGQHILDVATDLVRAHIGNFTEVAMPEAMQKISATQVRRAALDNDLDSVKDMIPKLVYDFLRKRG